MKSSWKKLLAAAAAALLVGVLLGGWLGHRDKDKDNGLAPAVPKEAVAHLKLADKDVPLYEYTGLKIPELQGFSTSLAVTKDAIYGISAESSESNENTYHLKKMSLKEGAVLSVEDFGLVANEPISSDGTNVYYFHKGDGIIARCDGREAATFIMPGVHVLRAVFGENKAYAGGSFVSELDTVFGTVSQHGMKNPRSVLGKDEFGNLAGSGDAAEENNAFLLCADKDGFYVATLAAQEGSADGKKPLHMYGPNGKKLRTFECNANLPAGAPKRTGAERQALATKDYVVFYGEGFLRVFNKKSGKYVGDVELKIGGRKLNPAGAAADDENHIYFIGDKQHIYRIDL